MKRSDMLDVITKFSYRVSEHPSFDNYDWARQLLNELERLGMGPPAIPTNKSGWEIGKGESAYVNEWEKE